MNEIKTSHWSNQAWAWVFFAALIALALLYYLLGNPAAPDSNELRSDRAAIKDCWKRHQNSPLSPTELKFVAEACEFMENEFIVKYRQEP